MTAAAAVTRSEAREEATARAAGARVLVVSEDPDTIWAVRDDLSPLGVEVVGCLGPAHGPCELYERGECTLTAAAAAVLVEAPPGGSFQYHHVDLPAGEYAEDLQRAYPESYVVLLAGDGTDPGPTGELIVVEDRAWAIRLIEWTIAARAIVENPKGGVR